MNKTIISIYFILLISSFIRCSNKEPVTKVTEIKIDFKNEVDISNSLTTNYFKSRKLIKLETTNESLISNINRLIVYDSNYYVFDRSTNSVYTFNEFGKYISKIKHIGSGPGEYIQLTDFTIDIKNKLIVLLCDIPNSIFYYDLNGNFVKQEKKSEYDHYISAENSSIFFASFLIDNKRKYLSYKKENKYIEFLPVEKYIIGKDFYGPHPNIIRSDFVFFFKVYDNTVYKLFENQAVPAYRIDFAGKAIDKRFLEENNLEKILMSCTDNILRINDFRECENYLTFGTWPFNKIVIYNKKDKMGKLFSKFYDPETGLYLSNMIAHDGPGDEIFFVVNPKNFANNILNFKGVKQNEIYFKFMEVASTLTENDNPMLISYSLK